MPEAKGGTEKGLLEVKAGFQEEAALEKKVEFWSLLYSLGSGLQPRPFEGLSDIQTCSMAVLFKHLPSFLNAPRVKHKLICFAHRCSESTSCLIAYSSPHIIFPPDTPSHLNSPGTFTHLHLCPGRTLHLRLLIWQTPNILQGPASPTPPPGSLPS